MRCNKSCENCPYYLSGKNALGNTFSLDKLVEEGVEVRALEKDVETEYIEKETIEEEHKVLRLFNLERTPFRSKKHSFILLFQLKRAFFEFP